MVPNTVANPTIGNNQIDQEIREDKISISPINLGEGGSPSLAVHIKSHQRVLSGNIDFRPRVMARVRVPLRS